MSLPLGSPRDLAGRLTVLLAAIASATAVQWVTAWVAVATTIATSLTAHVPANRYDHIVIEYLRTAQQLDYFSSRGDLTGAALVDACRDAISVENQAWMARISESPPASA